jgi:serralysin
MNGGAGVDTLDVTFFGGPYLLNMITGVTNFAGETAVNFENVNTGAGNDTINGSAASNVINTGAGNDTIFAGAGADIMAGGAGSDIYRYTAFSESTVGAGRDIINGFDRGLLFFSPKDKIDLSAIDANVLLAGDQAFTFIGTGAFTGTTGEARYFLSGTNVIVEVDVQGDGNVTADMQIQLNGIGGVNASNFIL